MATKSKTKKYNEPGKFASPITGDYVDNVPTPRPPFQPVKPQPAEIAPAPSQLDRIEALLLELVETNRKLHPI